MDPTRPRHNSAFLAIMLSLGVVYTGWLYLVGSLTGTPHWDGAIGVLLGLYMASHPAGNTLDILFFMPGETREKLLTTHVGRFWLLLNALVLLAAWYVIFIGLILFVRKPTQF